MLRALTAMLSERADVVAVNGVNHALDILKTRSFDLVVSDYEMGDGNGLDILNFVNRAHPETPVIIITAFGSKDMAIKTINSRVFGFLEKPFELYEVQALVERALEKKHHEDVVQKFANLGESAGQIVHEIANPLAILYSKLDELKELAISHRDMQLLTSAQTMAKCAQRICSIIKWTKNDLTKSGTVSSEIFEMHEVLEALREECLSNAVAKGVPVVILPGGDGNLRGSRQQLLEVLVNLINNAIEAAACQEEKWVKLEVEADRNGVQITVTDSGKGIPEEIRSKLFTPLFTTKRESGTGLGLVIAQKIVKAHGGAIFFNDKSKNTQFVVQLPTAA